MRKDNEIEVESKSINDNLKSTRPSSILNLRCFFMRGKKRKLKKKKWEKSTVWFEIYY